jgi:ribosomal protein S27E
MKLIFDNELIKERCSGCKTYCEHYTGKTSEGQTAWKCRICGRLTVYTGGDNERVVVIGVPPESV